MSAQECSDPFTRIAAHKLRRDAATHAKPLRFAGFIIRSQPMSQDVQRAALRVGEALQRAGAP